MGKKSRAKKERKNALVVPAPGLDGTWRDTCVVCLKGTDTGLGVRGEPEWHAAFLMQLNIPKKEAVAMVDQYRPPIDGQGRYDMVYRVCADCAEKARAPFPEPTLLLDEHPVATIAQPID